MPEPRIQYAKTSDGVSIAYAVFGSGRPLVYVTEAAGFIYTLSSLPANELTSAGFRSSATTVAGPAVRPRRRNFSLEARLLNRRPLSIIDLARFALVRHFSGGLLPSPRGAA
jgi:hypothetical protein